MGSRLSIFHLSFFAIPYLDRQSFTNDRMLPKYNMHSYIFRSIQLNIQRTRFALIYFINPSRHRPTKPFREEKLPSSSHKNKLNPPSFLNHRHPSQHQSLSHKTISAKSSLSLKFAPQKTKHLPLPLHLHVTSKPLHNAPHNPPRPPPPHPHPPNPRNLLLPPQQRQRRLQLPHPRRLRLLLGAENRNRPPGPILPHRARACRLGGEDLRRGVGAVSCSRWLAGAFLQRHGDVFVWVLFRRGDV